MSWVFLVAAGFLEVAWAIGLKYSRGFTKLVPAGMTLGAIAGSLWLLSLATRTLPIGTAYAVWVGIGAAGATILGAVLFDEPLSIGRSFFLGLLVVSIAGLKLTGSGASIH